MYDKTYLQYRTEYLLQKAIDAEIEKLKNSIRYNASTDISNRCTEIGLLVTLKNQAKDLIEKL